MIASLKPILPRWATALIMFFVSFGLLLGTYFLDILGEIYYFSTILLALMLWIYVDRQQPEELGFKLKLNSWLQLLLGGILAAVVLGLIIWSEVIFGWLILTPVYISEPPWIISGVLATYGIWQALVAVAEELVGRGYIQQNFAAQVSGPLAVLIASIMFACLHLPGIFWNALPPLNAILKFSNMLLGGVMLGVAFTRTQALWLPIGLHFGWNYMLYHIAGFGGDGLYQVQNLGIAILTGGDFGPEAGLIGTIAFLVLIAVIWISTQDGLDRLLRKFERKHLLLFLTGFLVVGIPTILGILSTGLWFILLVWIGFMIFFLQVWENRIVCSHCPYYAKKGRTLRCHANYGLLKLWKYNPAPMNWSEKVQVIIGFVIFIAFPFPFLVIGQQWFFLILAGLGTIIFGAILFGYLCPKCVNFSCPFNRVPKKTVDRYLKENPVMRKAWEEKGYRLNHSKTEYQE